MCTGNICRSPMAEALLRHHLDARGVDASVRSAGTMAWGGGATDHAVEVLRDRGLDLVGHESTQLDHAQVERADLVVGMTRAHVWSVTNRDAGAAARTFLPGELARLGGAVGARAAGEPVRAWLARVAATRPSATIVGRAGEEVPDPVGEPVEVYRATAARLDRDLAAVAALLVPD